MAGWKSCGQSYRSRPMSGGGRARRRDALLTSEKEIAQTDGSCKQKIIHRTVVGKSQGSARSEGLSSNLFGRVPSLGWARRRRLELFGLWSGRSLPGAGAAFTSSSVAGDFDRGDGFHHFRELLADHRVVSDRRRRLFGCHQTARLARRPGVGVGAGGRLYVDNHHLHRQQRRCIV